MNALATTSMKNSWVAMKPVNPALCLRILSVVQSTCHGAFPEVALVSEDTIMEEDGAEASMYANLARMTRRKIFRASSTAILTFNEALAVCLRHRGAHPEGISMASRHHAWNAKNYVRPT